MNIRFTPEVYQQLLEMANARNISIASLVSRIVEQSLTK